MLTGMKKGTIFCVLGGRSPRPYSIVRRYGPLDAALDRLVVQPQRLTDREKRRIFPIGEQYSRPFNPTRRLGPRLRDPSQLSRILVFQRQFDRPTPRRHKFNPAPLWTDAAHVGIPKPKMNPSVMTKFMESVV